MSTDLNSTKDIHILLHADLLSIIIDEIKAAKQNKQNALELNIYTVVPDDIGNYYLQLLIDFSNIIRATYRAVFEFSRSNSNTRTYFHVNKFSQVTTSLLSFTKAFLFSWQIDKPRRILYILMPISF